MCRARLGRSNGERGRDPADPSATQLLTPGRGVQAATVLALLLYTAYNVAAAGSSFRRADWRVGSVGVARFVSSGLVS